MRNREDSGDKRLNFGQEYSFPDDLLINILITLSTKDVMRCRCVCTRWRHLTSTSYFLDLFSQKIGPLTLAEEVDVTNGGSKQFMLNKWWKSESVSSTVCRFDTYPVYRTQCSGDGLLVLKSQHWSLKEFLGINPVCLKDEVTIFVPKELFSCTDACAIYFHPTLKDYCILWRMNLQGRSIRYMISSLGSNSWREIKNPWEHSVWTPNNIAVLVNQYIYWLVELREGKSGIMEFDIISEEFKVLPVPSYESPYLFDKNYDLLNVRGILLFFRICPWEKRVYQSTLMDRAEPSWATSIYSISRIRERLQDQRLRVIARVDEELLVVLAHPMKKSLFAINLKFGTTRKLANDYSAFVEFFPYQISYVSLRNYKAKIRMKENRQKDVKGQGILNGSLKRGGKKKRSTNGVK